VFSHQPATAGTGIVIAPLAMRPWIGCVWRQIFRARTCRCTLSESRDRHQCGRCPCRRSKQKLSHETSPYPICVSIRCRVHSAHCTNYLSGAVRRASRIAAIAGKLLLRRGYSASRNANAARQELLAEKRARRIGIASRARRRSRRKTDFASSESSRTHLTQNFVLAISADRDRRRRCTRRFCRFSWNIRHLRSRPETSPIVTILSRSMEFDRADRRRSESNQKIVRSVVDWPGHRCNRNRMANTLKLLVIAGF
jgi:hypothetical protein